MKKLYLLTLFIVAVASCKPSVPQHKEPLVNKLNSHLTKLKNETDNKYLRMHADSIMRIVNSQTMYLGNDLDHLLTIYNAFTNPPDGTDCNKVETYIDRKKKFIISWKSKHDGKISFAWVGTPENWDPEKRYPLYIDLHGYWDLAATPIGFLSFPFRKEMGGTVREKDGFLVEPWGRGNLWYQDIAEKDILECIQNVSDKFHVDLSQKYISGFSMGGYGAWHLGVKYPGEWKGVGVYAGAFTGMPGTELETELNKENVRKLITIPVFILCGNDDQLLATNKELEKMLKRMGHKKVQSRYFAGGHRYYSDQVAKMYDWFSSL